MNITPFDILREIENSPPFQKEDVIGHYINLPIKNWEGFLSRIEKKEADKVSVTLRVKEKDGYRSVQVLFDLALSSYPSLKVIKPNHRIIIKSAKIKSFFDVLAIVLYECVVDLGEDVKDESNQEKAQELVAKPVASPINIHNSQVHLGRGDNVIEGRLKEKAIEEGFWSKFFWQIIIAVPVGIFIVIAGALLLKHYFNI